ncbi:Nhlrc3 [Phodopus roborovskii]|uniref:Nhlrc3 protein n=1 Tax=Phodopus roborovskii TaxID=109678 RepID=A0AAU9YWN6_PHORO|nr:Nhlrc3 [Phodopus roborovskii]
MARVWVCVGGAVFFLSCLVLHACYSGSLVLRTFAFYIPWRKENTLFRLDLGWPKYSEYFTGSTFSVAVDSLNGLVYVAQDPTVILLKNIIPWVILFKSWEPQARRALA